MSQTTPPVEEQADDHTIRPFADWFREHNKDKTHTEMSEALHNLVESVRETGRPGTISLTFKVSPMKNTIDAILVNDAIVVKAPKPERRADVFYADGGNLVRQHPHQRELPGIREVPAPEIKEKNA